MWAEGVPNVNNSFTRNTIGVTILANNIGQLRRPGHHRSPTTWWPTRSPTAAASTSPTAIPGVNGADRGLRHLDGGPQHADPGRQLRLQLALRGRARSGSPALNEPINDPTINVTDTDIFDSSYAALHWIEGADHRHQLHQRATSIGAGTYALQVQAPSQVTLHQRAGHRHRAGQPDPQLRRHRLPDHQDRRRTPAGTRTRRSAGLWPAPQWGNTTTPPTGHAADQRTADDAADHHAAADRWQPGAGRPVTASSANGPYTGANAVDGNQATYWESNGAFPQTLHRRPGLERRTSAGWC